MQDNPFENLKARYLIFLFIASFIVAESIINDLPGANEWYWRDIALSYLAYSFLISGLIILCRGFNGSIWKVFGPIPEPVPYGNIAGLTVKLLLFSIGSIYLVYIPMALVSPGIVQALIIELPPLIYFNTEKIYFLENIFGFVSLVLIAPITEELIFRGFILHRWAHKWGVSKAVIYSSLLFGVMHIDMLGAFLFAFAMSIIYIKTRSLLLPVLCHMLNNFIAWIWTLFELNIYGLEYEYTLDDFMSEWWLGGLCLLLTLNWAWKYFRNNLPGDDWVLPYYSYGQLK